MNSPLTDTQLDEIEARLTAATPGPWKIEKDYCDCSEYGCSHPPFAVAFGPFTSFENTSDRHHADAEFAAHAPADVRVLLDENRRLRAELDHRTEALASADDPTRLRWGLNDVTYGDDHTTTVLLSGPQGEPYWLELEPERAAVLREDLAGPDSEKPALCGRTRDIGGVEHGPCNRQSGHREAYCRSAHGTAYFLAVDSDQDAVSSG